MSYFDMRYLLKTFCNLIFDFLDTYLLVKADELIANEYFRTNVSS